MGQLILLLLRQTTDIWAKEELPPSRHEQAGTFVDMDMYLILVCCSSLHGGDSEQVDNENGIWDRSPSMLSPYLLPALCLLKQRTYTFLLP